jgi:hypothetical protein
MFSIITLICLQIRLELQIINKNSEASLIASNILENMNTRSFENIKKYVDEFSGIGVSKKIEDKLQNIIIFGDEFTEKFFGTEIPNGYTVDFTVQNNLEFDILSDVDISVNYKIGNNDKSVHISTAFEREKITGCNNPILMDDYFTELGITSLNYSITPIKYSKNMNSFVATTKDDQEWYNYSAKKWAKVLVLPNDGDLKKLFIDEHDRISNQVNINGENLNVEDYIYVWIPNFSIKDGVSCFRYGTGKRAIRMSFLYSEGKYLYVNRVSEEVKDISDKCTFDGIYGVWRKLYNEEDEYYKEFNKTRFAPIILH